ncbi:kinase-like domain-containing protein [Phascolomyces articulosus]|uniref:Kinase-like domain-containing protein n=1 Tax=Phascolomyces articulosus TaxID=60185 RepID=A0AAD5PBH1_9FUNG|nr:kinase-like domain-containing protein [Phascolomyces articulosus]
MANHNQLVGEIINDRYKLESRIGGGSFGDVYIGHNIKTKDKVAVKLENTTNDHDLRLKIEYKVNQDLGDRNEFPVAKYYGHFKHYNVMVMELLGPSLEDLFHMCKRKFSLKTVLQIGKQMLSRIERMHKAGYIHRDIKPDNFAMGVEGADRHVVHVLDFGLAKRVKTVDNYHIKKVTGKKSVIGTARYTSINSHRGIEQSRRDDLESVGYTLVYFARGSLPWQGIRRSNNNAKYHEIFLKKDAITIEQLCEGLPRQFKNYFHHVYNLHFKEKPDYPMLHGLFDSMMAENGFKYDNVYEWEENKAYKNLIKPRLKNPPVTPPPPVNIPITIPEKKVPLKRKTKSQKKRDALAAGRPLKPKPKYICKADRARLGITTKTLPREQLKLYCI